MRQQISDSSIHDSGQLRKTAKLGGHTFEPYERFEASNAIIDEFASLRAEPDEDGILRVVVVLPDGEEVPLAIEVFVT